MSRRAAFEQGFGLTLACAPLGFDWFFKVVVEPRPFWAFYYDPELLYYFEGLGLLRGSSPLTFDRPGVPVQLASAALAAVLGRSPTNVDPFRLASYILTLLLALGAIALLWRTLLSGLPVALRVAGVWLVFLAPAALEYVAVWSPEALYLPIGALAMAALARLEGRVTERAERGAVARFGAAIGLAVSLKFTFLAWVPAGAAAVVAASGGSRLRKSARAALFGAVALGTFALLASYLLPRTGELVQWLWRLASRAGPYGEGAAGLPAFADWFDPLAAYALASKTWHLVLLALIVFAAWELRSPREGEAAARSDRPLALFALVAVVAAYVLALRSPEPRYLLTQALVAPLAVRFAARAVPWLRQPRGALVVLAVIALLVVRQVGHDLGTHRRRIAGTAQLASELQRTVARLAPATDRPVVVYGFRAPRPSYALHAFARTAAEHEAIFRRFPDDGFVDRDGSVDLPPGAAACDLLVLAEARPVEPDLAISAPLARVGGFVVVRPKTP